MKIRQIRNNHVNSFEFSINLCEEDYLKKILFLFQLKKIYLCIYGLKKTDKLWKDLNGLNIQNISPMNSMDYVLDIASQEISNLFSIIKDNFDEVTVWSCNKKWETFLNEISKEETFLTTRRISAGNEMGFYLNFKPYDFNNVEIISDLLFNNTASITKEDMISVLS